MTSFRFPKRPQTASHHSRITPLRTLLYAVPLMLLLAACNINQPNNPTPTVEILLSVTPTATRTPTVEATVAPTFTAAPQINIQGPIVIVTPELDNVPRLPTSAVTAAPLETPTPWSYIIQQGDNLGGILIKQPWGYNGNDLAIQRAVVQLNDMISADLIPPPGSELLIPQLTWTPIPQGAELTATAAAQMGGSVIGDNIFIAPGTFFDCYTVQEGDTMGEIAINYSASFELLSSKNRNLDWSGCAFNNPTGGPNCNPFITVGQCVMVPLPTAVPSFTPTASGSETPTPTPTRAASLLIYPPESMIMAGGTFRMDWVSVGLLASDQVYLVEVQDVTANTAPSTYVTRENSLEMPGDIVPSDGQTHQFQWRVTVVKKNAEGSYALSDGQGPWRPFQWQSR